MSMKPASWLSALLAPSDEQLMWRVQVHDDCGAFAKLVERWERPIWRLCARLTGDPHRAEDLKQDAFTRLFARRRDFRPPAKLSTWLWRIAVNLCHDEHRRVQRRSEAPLEMADEGVATAGPELNARDDAPDAALAAREEGELVREAVMRLSEPYRTVVVLRHYEGLKLREIAAVLEVPEGTVNSRMAEALTRLARLLAPQLEPRAARGPAAPALPPPPQTIQTS
jgi:RNA polymerase sigma-70 factor, ECF subfamily